MGSPLSRRRVLALTGATGLAAAMGCAGCAPGTAPRRTGVDGGSSPSLGSSGSSGPAGTPSTLPVTDTGVASRLWRARGDRAAWLALFAGDQRSRALGARLWSNLAALRVEAIEESGSGGVRFRWRPASGFASVDHVLDPALSDGLLQGLTPRGAAPVWLGEPIAMMRAGGVVTLRGASVPPTTGQLWLDAAVQALEQVRKAALGPLVSDDTLVLALPGSPAAFAAVLASPLSEAAGVGAVTQVATPASGPQVVVNLAAASGASASWSAALLTHEAVHAVSRSPGLPGPLWVKEGLAEWVSAPTYRPQRARNSALVVEAVASGDVGRLPPDADFQRRGVDLETAYALAQVAVDAAIVRWGRAAFTRWAADWDAPGRASDADLTSAFVAAASRVTREK